MKRSLWTLCPSLVVLCAGCRASLKIGDTHYAPVDGMLISSLAEVKRSALS